MKKIRLKALYQVVFNTIMRGYNEVFKGKKNYKRLKLHSCETQQPVFRAEHCWCTHICRQPRCRSASEG